jgi:hypothetical protein
MKRAVSLLIALLPFLKEEASFLLQLVLAVGADGAIGRVKSLMTDIARAFLPCNRSPPLNAAHWSQEICNDLLTNCASGKRRETLAVVLHVCRHIYMCKTGESTFSPQLSLVHFNNIWIKKTCYALPRKLFLVCIQALAVSFATYRVNKKYANDFHIVLVYTVYVELL